MCQTGAATRTSNGSSDASRGAGRRSRRARRCRRPGGRPTGCASRPGTSTRCEPGSPAVERFLDRAQPRRRCASRRPRRRRPSPTTPRRCSSEHGYTSTTSAPAPTTASRSPPRHPIRAIAALGRVRRRATSTANHGSISVRRASADPPLRVVSVYVPHGREVGHWHYDYKLAFLDALAGSVRDWMRRR